MVVLLAAPVVGLTHDAHAQLAEELLDSATTAFGERRFDEARVMLERVVELDAEQAEAFHLLARIYFEVEPRDLSKSRQANNRAIAHEPDNVRYLALRLARLHFFPSSFMPVFRTGRRQDLAERILELDPDNELAHFVLGEINLDDYLNARASVSLPDLDRLEIAAPRDAHYHAAYLVDPVLEPGVRSEIQFRTSRRYAAVDVPYVSRDDEAKKRYERAVTHLQAALAGDPLRQSTYRGLLTATILERDFVRAHQAVETMLSQLPHEPDAWLYRGLVSFRMNRIGEADSAFDRAFSLMGDSLAAAYLDTSRFLSRTKGLVLSGDASDFWARSDPFLLTPQNERWLEHFARMVYTDVRFGDLFPDRRGWETEPGEVVVRYGVPLGEAQMSTRFDRYLVLHYGDFFFKFMDLAKAGGLTFYSPKTGMGRPSLDEAERAFEEDFTLVSRRLFRQLPERFVYDRHGTRQPIPYLVSVMNGVESNVDLYVVYGVPHIRRQELPEVRSGAWLLDESGEIVVASVDVPSVGLPVQHNDVEYQVLARRLTVPSGDYTIAVEYETSANDQAGFHRQPLSVRSVDEGAPGISDLVLAYSVEEGAAGRGMRRGGFLIQPAPWGVFTRGQPIYVFFETYNLAEGAGSPRPYRIQAFITPYDGEEDPREAAETDFARGEWQRVSVSYSAEARARQEPQYLILDTSESEVGTYVLGLRLIGEDSGTEAFAARAIIIE